MSTRTTPFTESIGLQTMETVVAQRPSVQPHSSLSASLLCQVTEKPIIQITEELLVVLLAVHVMCHVPLCPAKNPRVQVVHGPETVIASMRLHKQTSDENIVDEARKLVFWHAQDADVLNKNVDHHLQRAVKKPMVHCVQCEDAAAEVVDLMMLVVVVAGAWERSMHSNVNPGKHKVIRHNSKANFCHKP